MYDSFLVDSRQKKISPFSVGHLHSIVLYDRDVTGSDYQEGAQDDGRAYPCLCPSECNHTISSRHHLLCACMYVCLAWYCWCILHFEIGATLEKTTSTCLLPMMDSKKNQQKRRLQTN